MKNTPNKEGLKNINKRKSERGVVLLITVIFSTITLMVAVSMTVKFENQLKKARSVKAKNEKEYILEEMAVILKSKRSCKTTLLGANANSTAIGVIKKIISVRGKIDNSVNQEAIDPLLAPQFSDQTIFVANKNQASATVYGNRAIQIYGFSLKSPVLIPGNSFGETLLTIFFREPDKTGLKYRKGELNVSVKTDVGANIVECQVRAYP